MAQKNTKRVAKNTLYMYIRMAIIMLVSLYTSRVVLAQLGVTSYGIYTVVGGVVSMFGFLNACMTVATQRYLNYEMGNNGEKSPKLKCIFSTSFLIHVIIAIVALILAETIGLWFVNTKLVIPEDCMYAANIVYQTSVVSFCIAILRVPFNAALIAHEKMNIYAIVSILEALLLLLSAYLLSFDTLDKLAFYGWLIMIVHVAVAMCYILYGLRNYNECSLQLKYSKYLFGEMIRFAGWNMFGSVAWIARGQGLGIILNLFYGPALNAAKGIADQVFSAVSSFTNNFQIALNPQITKLYAAGEYSDMEKLAYQGIKFSCILIWLISLPIMLNINLILDIWLERVPQYASLFVILILFDCFSSALFGQPLMTSLSATGKIRSYQVVVSCVLLLIIPVSYIALQYGLAPESIFYLNIFFNIFAGIVRFWFCWRQIHYSAIYYLKYALIPIIGILAVSSVIPVALKFGLFYCTSIPKLEIFIILILSSLISVSITGWVLGFNKMEKKALKNFIRSKLNR